MNGCAVINYNQTEENKMFQINTDGVRSASYSIRDGGNQLNRHYYEIEDVKGLLSGLSGMVQVIATLNSLQNDVRLEARQEEALYETAQRIVIRYEDCEEGIIENMDNDKFGFGVTSPKNSLFRLDKVDSGKVNIKVLKELLGLFNG